MTAQNTHFARRSLLFMPGDSLRKIEKGASWDVDTIIMDMEDAVAQNRKLEARATIAQALSTLAFGKRERIVRLNHLSTGFVKDEIASTIQGRPDGYIMPKAQEADELLAVDSLLTQAEQAHGLQQRQHTPLCHD